MGNRGEGMDFGEAIRSLKEGKRVRRAGWEDTWLCLVPGVMIVAGAHERVRKFLPVAVDLNYGSHIVLHASNGLWQPGWVPTQLEMFAEDWEVVDD